MVPTKVVSIYKDRYDVYIGRAGKGKDGYFGNPYKVGTECSNCGLLHKFGSSTLPCYAEYLSKRVSNDSEFRSRLKELQGKTLGCFCAPEGGLTGKDRPWRCHGQIIAWFVDNILAPTDKEMGNAR